MAALLKGGAILLASAAFSAVLIILLHDLLRRYALARPNGRSSHREPTPQGGGIAVVVATLTIASVAVMLAEDAETGRLWPVFAAAIFLAIVGAWDDIKVIAAAPRLLLQLLAVALVVATLPAELRIVPSLPWGMERAGLLLAGLWFVNLVNFMDGIDWMTVAEVVPVTGGLVLLGCMGVFPSYALVVALALCGAIVGFAPFNRPVAKLFLGDVGSLPIGLLLGWMLLLLAGNGHLAAALLLPLYYLADATITLFRRLYNGENIWQAHRSHFYQRATDSGFTVPQIVARVFVVNIALAALALATVLFPLAALQIAALAAGGCMVAWLLIRFERGRSAA